MKLFLTRNGWGTPVRVVLMGIAIAICSSFIAATLRAAALEPAITAIALDGNDVLITVQVPPGLKRITLQSSRRLGTGAWEPRAVLRLGGEGGEVTFRVPRSPELEIVRVRADERDPLPMSFYQGTNSFSGIRLSAEAGTSVEMDAFGTASAVDSRLALNEGTAAPAPRDVVESDIWRIEGDVLYFFNQYRGLQVIDLVNPDSPVIRGTFPLAAAGEQMYVLSGNEVVLLASNGCGWAADSASQVLIVGTAGGLPNLLTSLPLSGQIQESRLVGTALYVMTQTYRPVAEAKDGAWEWGTSLYAFDLAKPAAPVARPTLWYAGYGNVLSATDQYLFVSVQNNSGSSQVNLINISAPDGTMRKAGSVRVAGQVKDKFKIHLHEDVLTVISEAWLAQFPDGSGRSQLITKLETFSLADPASPRKLGDLALAAGEQLHATRFDGDRVYIVTFFRIDPLWVVDLSDPTNPAIRGELEVPGWSTYIQPLGDRLLTIGIDNTNGWRVAVSLFDVHDPTAPALLSKVPLGENSSWSEANSDEKAFGFLPEAGLILVPYSSYTTNHQQGVQLIDLAGDTLVKRGFIAHEVQARRSTIHRDRILSISGRELLSVDASNRDKPVVRSETELAWPVNRVFVQDGYLVELETGSGGWNEQIQPTLRVAQVTGPDRVLNSLALPTLPVAGATLRDGRLYLLQGSTTYSPTVVLSTKPDVVEPGTKHTVLVCSVIDLAKLPAIELISSTELTSAEAFNGAADPVWPKPDLLVWVTRQTGYWPRWYPVIDVIGGISIMPIRGLVEFWRPFSGSGECLLLAVDTKNPQSLQFVSEVSLSNTNGWANFSKPFAADNSVFISEQFTQTSISSTNFYLVTNTTHVLATNAVLVTNITKIPHYETTTNATVVTNVLLAAIENRLGLQPVILQSILADLPRHGSVIDGGAFHSIVVAADGRVWTWGNNGHGQLGDDTLKERDDPKAVPTLASVDSAASGELHNLALRADGTVWAWGDGSFGQLGENTAPSPGDLPPMPNFGTSFPVQITDLSAVTAIGAGSWHSFAVQADGSLWAWGANWAGQLGIGTLVSQARPVRVLGVSEVAEAAGGHSHSLALRRDGSVWAWGGNGFGQLGDGTTNARPSPGPVSGLADVTALACGHSHNLALKKDGTVWSWGLNQSGQLGDGTMADRLQPGPVAELSDVISIACGQRHSLALRNDGSVWIWGGDKDGQLALAGAAIATRPVLAKSLRPAALIGAGVHHSLAVTAGGDVVYAWGRNDYGQLGSGAQVIVTNIYVETNLASVVTWTEATEIVLRTNVVKIPQSTTVTNQQLLYTSSQISYLHVIDYAAPAAPLLRRAITVPGTLQGLSHNGAVVYLLGPQVQTESIEDSAEWLHACAYDGVACYLVDSHPVPKEWPHSVLVQQPHVFVTRPEVEKIAERALEVWAVTDAGKFTKLNERKLAANAYALHAVGEFLVVQEDNAIELFDLTRPTELPWVGGGRPPGCLGWSLENAAGTFEDGFWLPLDAYGVDRIEVKR